jgi:hypothetical protein
MWNFFKSLVLLCGFFDDIVVRILKKGDKTMKIKRSVLIVGMLVFVFGVVVWLTTGIEGAVKRYEVHPYVGVPEYRTDAARAIDAYERLMDRYMSMTERELYSVSAYLSDISQQMEVLDAKMNRLHARLGRIEKKLGIATDKQPQDQTKRAGQRRRANSEENQLQELE